MKGEEYIIALTPFCPSAFHPAWFIGMCMKITYVTNPSHTGNYALGEPYPIVSIQNLIDRPCAEATYSLVGP